MTITANQIRRQLVARQKDYAHIRDTLPHAVAAIAEHIANGADRDDKPRAEDAGVRGIGHISDPTAAQALSHGAAVERHLGHIEDDLNAMWLIVGRLVDACNRWVAPAWATEEHPRCSGGKGYGVEPWTRPDCGELVECDTRSDGSPSYRSHGLCVRCRKARDRWHNENQDAA